MRDIVTWLYDRNAHASYSKEWQRIAACVASSQLGGGKKAPVITVAHSLLDAQLYRIDHALGL